MKSWASQTGFFVLGSILLFLGVIFNLGSERASTGEVGPLFLVGMGLSFLSSWVRKRVA